MNCAGSPALPDIHINSNYISEEILTKKRFFVKNKGIFTDALFVLQTFLASLHLA